MEGEGVCGRVCVCDSWVSVCTVSVAAGLYLISAHWVCRAVRPFSHRHILCGVRQMLVSWRRRVDGSRAATIPQLLVRRKRFPAQANGAQKLSLTLSHSSSFILSSSFGYEYTCHCFLFFECVYTLAVVPGTESKTQPANFTGKITETLIDGQSICNSQINVALRPRCSK